MLKLVVGLAAISMSSLGLVAGPSLSVHNEGRSEHVRIQAPADRALTLTGWRLSSAVGDQKYNFPATSLAAGAVIRIVSGATEQQAGDLVWGRQNVWNNDGDIARLFDASGALVAEVSYGTVARQSSALKASSAKGSRTIR